MKAVRWIDRDLKISNYLTSVVYLSHKLKSTDLVVFEFLTTVNMKSVNSKT
jgi:hypothetical protein